MTTTVLPRNLYVDELFNSYACADILPYYSNYTRVKERDKEISESMSCLHAAIDYLSIDKKDQNTTVLVVGDGKYPRTGVLFAFFTSWHVVSIDPLLDKDWEDAHNTFKCSIGKPVKRLLLFPKRFGEFSETEAFRYIPKHILETNLVVVLPHSHVSFPELIDTLAEVSHDDYEYTMISLPCCTKIPPQLTSKRAFDRTQFIQYDDLNVMSERRTLTLHRKMSKTIYDSLVPQKKKQREE